MYFNFQIYSCIKNGIVPKTDKWCYGEGQSISIVFKFKDIVKSNSEIKIRVTANLIYRRKKGKIDRKYY